MRIGRKINSKTLKTPKWAAALMRQRTTVVVYFWRVTRKIDIPIV